MKRLFAIAAVLWLILGTAQQGPAANAGAQALVSESVQTAAQAAPAAAAPVEIKTGDLEATLATQPKITIQQALGATSVNYDWPMIPGLGYYQETSIDRYVVLVLYRPRPVSPDGKFYFVTANSGGDGPPTDIRRFISMDDRIWILQWRDKTGIHERYELGPIEQRGSLGSLPFGIGEFGFGAIVHLSDGRVAYDCEFSSTQTATMDGHFEGGGNIGHYQGGQGGRLPCQFQWPAPIPPATPTPTPGPVATPTPAPCYYDSAGNYICPGPVTTPAPASGCTAYEEPFTPSKDVLWRAGMSYPNQLVTVQFWSNWWGNDQTLRIVLEEPYGRRPWFRGGGRIYVWPIGCEQVGRDRFNSDSIPKTTLQWLYERGFIVY